MASDGTSPVVIPHTLGEVPAKVDVQVKVTYNGIEYMFPGMGSAPRDDDLAADYGGVGYLYNELEVKVYVPVATNSGNGPGWAITTGGALYAGPFVGSFTSCDVRVRAWKLSYWPTPNFVGSAPISKSSPYADVPHGLGVYPDFVTVQLTLSDGYVSEAQGTTTTTSDHSTKWVNSCGTIFGVTDSSVTLWAAAGADDFVACFKDGWGTEDVSYSSASVDIRAWVLTPSEVIQNDVYPYTQSVTSLPTELQLTSLFHSDFHIVIVETKDNSVAHGRAFYGAGSASQGELNEAFGGTVYGYSQSQAVLWTSDVSYGKPIYVDGIWGGGTDPLQVSDVLITIRVIATGALIIPVVACPPPPSIADGYYDLSNDTVQYFCNEGFSANQTKSIFNCNNTIWENITFSCEVMLCQEPITISNAVHVSNGYQNGSQTLYSCIQGYAGNIGNRITTCDGTHWSNTTLTCENIISKSCGLPPYIKDAFLEIENDTVTYHCREGHIANQTMNTAHCINGQWTQLSLGCINTNCGTPPIIPNTLRLSNGFNNESVTLYSCNSGFSSNGEDPTIFCNGTHWSITQFNCLGNTCTLKKFTLHSLFMLSYKGIQCTLD
ncbi:uncharacterized protein LOC128185149 [Crassostrea angulata]|uniref:uncharacterized protein LOC128185149 n=1 Tax=Magallana angulata TaxID=2784310 RepID=UPI0022B15CAF|nr:uncharacterized protein LOC128185149 [Crassostrea angulata]